MNLLEKIDIFLSEATKKEVTDIEVTDKKVDIKGITNAWPEHVMYKNSNIFDIVYNKQTEIPMDAITKELEEYNDSDEYDDVDPDFQEGYLGYHTKSDTFIMGFDMWISDDIDCGIVKFKIKNEKIQLLEVIAEYTYGGFYNNGYKKVHKEFKGIIDIRLD